MAEAMGVKFLAQGNNSSRKVPAENRTRAPGLEPHDYQTDAQTTGLLLPPKLLLPPNFVGTTIAPTKLKLRILMETLVVHNGVRNEDDLKIQSS